MLEKYCEIFSQVYKGNNIEEAMELLKASGAFQMDTVKVLMDELNISIRDADYLVLNSTAWKEAKEFTEYLRDGFADILKNQPGDN